MPPGLASYPVTDPAAGLAGDTPVVTADRGLCPIEALRDQHATLLTTAGWVAGTVVCLGRHLAQELTLLSFQPAPHGTGHRESGSGRVRHTIVAARGRVLVQDGERAGLFFGDGTRN
jgi:hypothetical protein